MRRWPGWTTSWQASCALVVPLQCHQVIPLWRYLLVCHPLLPPHVSGSRVYCTHASHQRWERRPSPERCRQSPAWGGRLCAYSNHAVHGHRVHSREYMGRKSPTWSIHLKNAVFIFGLKVVQSTTGHSTVMTAMTLVFTGSCLKHDYIVLFGNRVVLDVSKSQCWWCITSIKSETTVCQKIKLHFKQIDSSSWTSKHSDS